jgi:hypothetical protein
VTYNASPTQQVIADEEVLYRAVLNDPRMLPEDNEGNLRISTLAFNDPARRPSVDRAVLCPGGPEETRKRFSPGSGVLSMTAANVRNITTVHGVTGQVYGVDVEAVPLPENASHAEIFGRPPFDTDKIFDRIKQSLARIATVVMLSESVSAPE